MNLKKRFEEILEESQAGKVLGIIKNRMQKSSYVWDGKKIASVIFVKSLEEYKDKVKKGEIEKDKILDKPIFVKV